MNRITKRVSAACLALLMTASAGASSLPFSFSESKAVIVASAEDTPEYSAAESHYREVLAKALAVNPDDYSADSYAKFKDRVTVYDLSMIWMFMPGKVVASDSDYEMKALGIESAYQFLDTNKEQTNYKDLEALLNKCDNINKDDYTEESYEAFSEGYATLKGQERYSLESAAELEQNGNSPRIYTYIIRRYEEALSLLEKKSSVTVTKKDDKTGAEISYNDTYISSDLDFVVEEYNAENWDWVNLDFPNDLTTAPSICANYGFYQFSLFDKSGERSELTDKFTVTMPIPDKFEDADKIRVNLYKNDRAKGGIAKVDIDKENRQITITFNYFDYLYYANGAGIVIAEPITTVDPETLADGVYNIKANLTNAGDVSRTSMANGTLDHDAVLVKNGNDVDIYLNFIPMYVLDPDTPSYTGGLWCESGDCKIGDNVYNKDSQTILSYYTNPDGSLCDNEIYNGVTEVNTPKTIKLHLDKECWQTDNYVLTVMSPAMAAMNNMSYEELCEQWDDLNVRLKLSDPNLIGSLDFVDEYIPHYDKSALRYEIDYSKSLDELDYTAESWQNLMDVVDIAQAKYDGEATTTEEIAEQIGLVQAARDALVIDDSEDGDKADLEALVAEAKKLNEDDYTKSSWSALQDALASAEKVLAKEHAKQPKIDAAKDSLQSAIDALEKKPETALDKDNLADGKYTLTAEMIKTDRKSKSMSNNAINHTVQLEVVDGEYFVTMQFKGLAIYNQFGYLKDLGYYDAGYTYNDYGIPQGTVLPAEVLSTYDTVDQYNDADNLYPQLLKFKLVDKASADFVPLQVFVPIMEAIAEGTGTQDVLMQLDWSTLVKVDDDAPIDIEEPEEQSPAVDLTDAATGVKIHADKGVFEEGVQLVVTPVTSGSDFDNAKKALDGTAKAFSLYEIHFIDKDGSTVQPNGTVSVSVPVPADYSDKLAVYRINDNAGKTLMSGEAKDGFYTYLTKSFSLYALADTNVTASNTPAENKPADNGNSGNPQTGAAAMGFAGIALAGAALILTRRKEK